MASPLPLAVRRSILHLPPSLRVSAVCQHATTTTTTTTTTARRSFSSSAPRPVALADYFIAPPTAVLDAIHACGVPWYAAIPLSAVLVRGTIGYHFAARPARRRQIKRAVLQPVIDAQTVQQYAEWDRGYIQSLHGREGTARRVNQVVVWQRFVHRVWFSLRNNHQTGKQFGAPLFTWANLINFGILITFAEAIRKKCGASEGLLSVLVGPISDVRERASARTTMSPDELLAERLSAAQEARQAQIDAARQHAHASNPGEAVFQSPGDVAAPSQDFPLSRLNSSEYADFLDPSLKLEGLSWCQDLTLADSTLILPASLALTLALSTLLRRVSAEEREASRPKKAARLADADATSAAEQATWDRQIEKQLAETMPAMQQKKMYQQPRLTRRQRWGLSAALIAGILFAKLPAAYILYFIPSFLTGWLQTRWLDVRHPVPRPIRPCKRPRRLKLRQQLRNV